jgi:hypothetical protein
MVGMALGRTDGVVLVDSGEAVAEEEETPMEDYDEAAVDDSGEAMVEEDEMPKGDLEVVDLEEGVVATKTRNQEDQGQEERGTCTLSLDVRLGHDDHGTHIPWSRGSAVPIVRSMRWSGGGVRSRRGR